MDYQMSIEKWGRYWAVYWMEELVCVCVYKRGAREVCNRLMLLGKTKNPPLPAIEVPQNSL